MPDGTPYILRFEEREGYHLAEIKADTIDGPTASAYLKEISTKCQELMARRLLIVRDIPTMLYSGTLYFTTKDFMESIRGTKIAFVNPHPSIHERMKFAILIAGNAGAAVNIHETIAEAEKWLLST